MGIGMSDTTIADTTFEVSGHPVTSDTHEPLYTLPAGRILPGAVHEWCRRCGGANVIWAAASPLWNYVMRGNDITQAGRFGDLVCMPCFIALAVEAGLPAHGWRLTLAPEPDGLVYETPSGRVWDPERFLWVEPAEADR